MAVLGRSTAFAWLCSFFGNSEYWQMTFVNSLSLSLLITKHSYNVKSASHRHCRLLMSPCLALVIVWLESESSLLAGHLRYFYWEKTTSPSTCTRDGLGCNATCHGASQTCHVLGIWTRFSGFWIILDWEDIMALPFTRGDMHIGER